MLSATGHESVKITLFQAEIVANEMTDEVVGVERNLLTHLKRNNRFSVPQKHN